MSDQNNRDEVELVRKHLRKISPYEIDATTPSTWGRVVLLAALIIVLMVVAAVLASIFASITTIR